MVNKDISLCYDDTSLCYDGTSKCYDDTLSVYDNISLYMERHNCLMMRCFFI